MGAAGSISDDAMKENIKISQFCDDKLKSIRYIPRMDECFDATFPGPEGDASRVPQKYIWLQGVCAAFVIFTDMKGKTLPELWDDYAGAGFTDHTTETMIGQAKQVMMQTLSPEIKSLINTDITESENKERWTTAIGRVEYANLRQAHAKQQERDKSNNSSSNSSSSSPPLMFSLMGVPDEEFPVSLQEWQEYVFRTNLVTSADKWNGVHYTRTELESIAGHAIDEKDISYE